MEARLSQSSEAVIAGYDYYDNHRCILLDSKGNTLPGWLTWRYRPWVTDRVQLATVWDYSQIFVARVLVWGTVWTTASLLVPTACVQRWQPTARLRRVAGTYSSRFLYQLAVEMFLFVSNSQHLFIVQTFPLGISALVIALAADEWTWVMYIVPYIKVLLYLITDANSRRHYALGFFSK